MFGINLDPTIVEIFGVAAGILVLVSFLMKGEKKIRIINIFGASVFIFYGIFIKSVSVTLLNSGLVLVHIYKLLEMKRAKENENEIK
ncbi:MAG TPA: YgjV family protein [Acholeplasma sp.]|nr:YgjV family protein [Acholeplasma sp.]